MKQKQTATEAWAEFGVAAAELRNAVGWSRFTAWADRHPLLCVVAIFTWPLLVAASIISAIVAS